MEPICSPVSTRLPAIILRALALLVFAVSSGAAPPDELQTAAIIGTRQVTIPPPERLDDPPATTASLGLRAEGPQGVYVLGPSTSVQVNVNASGNNIIGDAANEPTIAIDRNNPNHIAIAWRQFDDVTNNHREAGHAYSTDGGQTWTFPGVLQPGVFRSDPVMASDASGTFYWSSLSIPGGGFAAEIFRSMDGGITWLAPVEAFGGDKQWINVDVRASGMGAGHIYQNWTSVYSCCGFTDFTRSINLGTSYQGPFSLPSPSMMWGTGDVSADGTLYIAGSAQSQDGHLVTRSSNARDSDVTPSFEFVNNINLGGLTGGFGGASDPNPGGLLGQVWLATDPTNVNRLYILGSVVPPSGNPIDVMFIRSVNKAVNWSAPRRVNDDPVSSAFHWFGTMSVAPNGRIDVVWNDSRASGIGYVSELYYSFSVDTGFTWSSNVPLSPAWNSHEGWPNQNKIGDYYHMISDNGGASLAYAATFNFNPGLNQHEQDVYFLRIIADCNHNGIPDDQDVANGAPDCNHNLIPDECESSADCNHNGIADICDIFSGFSADCNLDLIPDECENPTDCNNNGLTDFCDIANGALDCNQNSFPDLCDISSGSSQDTNNDQIPDECEGACCQCNGSCSLTTSGGCTVLSGFFNGTGSSCSSMICGAPNDFCANRTILPPNPTVSVPFSNQCATLDGPSPVNCDAPNEPIGADLWYEYVAPCTGTVRASLCGATNFDSILAVYGGSSSVCDCQQILSAPLACGDDTCGVGGGPSQVTFSAVADRCYLIRVAGWNSNTGNGVLQISYDTFCSLPPGGIIWNADAASPDRTTRSLRFRVTAPQTATATSGQVAIKVTMVDLQHPNPRNAPSSPPANYTTFDTRSNGVCSGGQFNGHHCDTDADCVGTTNGTCTPLAACTATGETNGCARWVSKPGTFYESEGPPQSGPYLAARLQCTPFYWDWITETASAPLTVVGAEIVPSSEYSVQDYAATCIGSEATCTDVSTPVTMYTRRLGDVDAPYNPGSLPITNQPNATDIAQLVNKFKNLLGAPVHARAQLQPNLPELNASISALDIVAVVDAFKGLAYAFSGPCPCPSTVTCGGLCTGCAGMCVKTCTGGANDGEPCIGAAHCPGGACSATETCRDRCGRCTP